MRSLVCGCKQMQKPSSKINMVKRSKHFISSVTNMMKHYNHCQLLFMIETLSLSLYESIYIYIDTHAIIKTTEDTVSFIYQNLLPCIATLYPLWGHSPCQLAWAVCPGSRLATLQPWFWRRILGRGWWWKCIMENWQIFLGKTVPSNGLWEEDLPTFYCRWTGSCWWHILLIRWQQRSCIDVVKLRPLNLKLWRVNKCWTSPLHQRHYTADIIASFLLTMILDVTRTRWCRVGRLPFQEMEVPTLQVEK